MKTGSMSTMNIRIATPNDAEFIAWLGRITFTETFLHLFRDKQDLIDYCDLTFSAEKIAKSLAKPNTIYWISFVDRLPVAYAKLKLDSESEFLVSKNICQLQKIYVLRDFLSKRIGFELQRRLLEMAKERGYKQIWLSVLESNERAKSFYLKNGFGQIGKHDFQIGQEQFNFIAMSQMLK